MRHSKDTFKGQSKEDLNKETLTWYIKMRH